MPSHALSFMETQVIRNTIYWYRRYMGTLEALLEAYGKEATTAQWRRTKVSVFITAVLGGNKEKHVHDLNTIFRNPGTDDGFKALLYFSSVVGRLIRQITVLLFGGLLYMALYLWFAKYGTMDPRWFGTVAVSAFAVWLVMKRLGLCVLHHLSNNATNQLLGMFLVG